MPGISDFSERAYIFGECQISNASFLLGLLQKIVGLQKTILWAPVWDFGFQRTHLQTFGESQFYNAYFRLGPLLKYAGLQEQINIYIYMCVYVGQVFGIPDFSKRVYKVFGESQLYNAYFLSGFLPKCNCLRK